MFLLIQGTGFVYETLLRPFIIKHETDIDKNLQELRSRTWNLATYYYHNCTELGPTKIFELIESLASKHGKIERSSSQVHIVPASLQSLRATCLICILSWSITLSYLLIATCMAV